MQHWFVRYAFFVPNLVVIEYILLTERRKSTLLLQIGATIVSTAFYFFIFYAAYNIHVLSIWGDQART